MHKAGALKKRQRSRMLHPTDPIYANKFLVSKICDYVSVPIRNALFGGEVRDLEFQITGDIV